MKAVDLRNGTMIDLNGEVYQVIEFSHHVDTVHASLRNIATNAIIKKVFIKEDTLKTAYLEKKDLLFDEIDDGEAFFIDLDSLELLHISQEHLPEGFRFVNAETTCQGVYYEGQFIQAIPPRYECHHVKKIDSTSRNQDGKLAVLENGEKIVVPEEIQAGDKIKVDVLLLKYVCRE